MKLIVGLGNPGEKYKNTRHNAGFLAIDFLLADDRMITAKPSHEFKSEMHTWMTPTTPDSKPEKVVFLKPQTYMNDSGQALKVICNFYKMDLSQDLLVIHDEVDLPFGEFRLTQSSSDAGHNGVKSVIENLGTQNFHRLRLGIETRASRQDMPTEAFVLQDFNNEEIVKLQTEIFPAVKTEFEKFIQLKNA